MARVSAVELLGALRRHRDAPGKNAETFQLLKIALNFRFANGVNIALPQSRSPVSLEKQ